MIWGLNKVNFSEVMLPSESSAPILKSLTCNRKNAISVLVMREIEKKKKKQQLVNKNILKVFDGIKGELFVKSFPLLFSLPHYNLFFKPL